MKTCTAQASPNIAFIKYWGNRDDSLRIPQNDSLSMNLADLHTTTSVQFDDSLVQDEVTINGIIASRPASSRVAKQLDIIRELARINLKAQVVSHNNFPMGSGIASSASSFAALTIAGCSAAGLDLDVQSLSRIARRGSGSACRSIPPGFVIWHAGASDDSSYAESFASCNHWDLVDCVAISSEHHKQVGSSEGHRIAATSPLQPIRLKTIDERIAACKQAIISKDFELLSAIVEQDSNLMHSIMSTSSPKLQYWDRISFDVMTVVQGMRKNGIEACYTLDAGPNVHIITRASHVDLVEKTIAQIPGIIRTVRARTGDGARIIKTPFPT